ncbi:unnamed protein product [Ostreobium quekettii]|uniref:Uracil-DNA glycosylase n=1 Tax=Ostreobium quekettii TaxID=121088 RepID=A0A8S1J0B1_9CHLO|nr:unnamed protein product [Ostreobium quekettii]|eukprot:evm.model.scf_401.5 EVM.evm.TU.scf_401.5   scf_401:28184-30320(-)
MGKRSIEDFFHHKSQPKRQRPERAGTSTRAEVVDLNADVPAIDREERVASASGSGAGQATDGAPGDPDASALSAAQKQNILVNKNMALARQAVASAVKNGQHPELRSLLVEETWKSRLSKEFGMPYFAKLQGFVHKEWSSTTKIFPPSHTLFNALNSCPFESVKVVIIGQDPYHGENQAMGLCFSVSKEEKIPPSLRNMYKELHGDVGCSIPDHGDLSKWARQGVVLLNAVLTVRAHEPNSHAKQGWENFTDAVISHLNKERKGLVFLLWGKPAQMKGKRIDRAAHCVLETVHPSPLSANKGFFGCGHFSKANKYLEKNGLTQIDWQID